MSPPDRSSTTDEESSQHHVGEVDSTSSVPHAPGVGSVGTDDENAALEMENRGSQTPYHDAPLNGEGVRDGAEDTRGNQHGNGKGVGEDKMDVDLRTGEEEFETKVGQLSLLPSSTESPVAGTEALSIEEGRDVPAKAPSIPLEHEAYLDPTPKTPGTSAPISRASSRTASNSHHAALPGDYDLPPRTSPRAKPVSQTNATQRGNLEPQDDEDARSEIQSIMDQFDDEGGRPGEEEVMSPRLGLAAPLFPNSVQHPPRMSSLEPVRSRSPAPASATAAEASSQSKSLDDLSQLQSGANNGPGVFKAPSLRSSSLSDPALEPLGANTPASPEGSPSFHRPPLPEPDPEPDLPFDFHRFLEQLRHRTADPVAKFLRSFLIEFGKKQWMVHEQVKIISDFLAFITNKMALCEVWRGVSDAEFDNAKEGMEKLVMNRLYSQTFSPAIPPPVPVSEAKNKGKNTEKILGPGRRGQHQEDIERDEILAQKVRIYGWVQAEHLDIAPVGDSGSRFLALAQQELLKIKTYRAPRDKVICVLNCCKVIFGLLRNSRSADTSADSFVPLLIYVVLHANPDHLVSNVQYILRFRNQDKLGGEAGYYLSSLMGAVQFIENLDRTTLTVSDEEFEKNVEAAVSAIAERHNQEEPQAATHPQISEKSGLSRPEVTPRNSMEAEYFTPRQSTSLRDGTDPSIGGDGIDEKAAVSGLLRTIQRPLSSIGRIFSEESTLQQQPAKARSQPPATPQPGVASRLSPAVFQPPRSSDEGRQSDEEYSRMPSTEHNELNRFNAEDAAARQASAEVAEAQRIQTVEHHNVVETLAGMFPDLDKDIINDVVRIKEGRVGLAVDACLALSSS